MSHGPVPLCVWEYLVYFFSSNAFKMYSNSVINKEATYEPTLQSSVIDVSGNCQTHVPACRFLLYFFSGKAFKICTTKHDSNEPEDETTYESALQSIGKTGCKGHRVLHGAPTYRMPHHPRYQDMFNNAMYKPIWFRAFGRLRFTQLVSRLAQQADYPSV
eukprot:GHRR01031945.1.p2 GENE.GHRR01031945.1~~GHRR01031945.1.p2  ORF type:complete len:160 (-),score=40.15 GHRR01031945.1:117-596(-)